MLRKILVCLLVVFVPLQSWAVIDMDFQHQQNAQQTIHIVDAVIAHSCHQSSLSKTDSDHTSHQTLDGSGCNSCTLCMAIGFLQVPQAIVLVDFFSQAFYSINQHLIGVDTSSLTKPPIR